MDEPESALDFRLRYQAMELLQDYIQQNHASALITLHDSALALNYCNSLLILSDGRLIGTIIPSETSISEMEQLLSKIYGTISLSKLNDRLGNSRLVMMKEAETS